MPLDQRVATELRMLMAAQQKTVTEMAGALSLDRKVTLQRYRGERSLTLTEVSKLADWLGVDDERLLLGERLAVAS